MASGLPCIVSDIPNLCIVRDADCGIIMDFSDPLKTSETILDYMKRDNRHHSINAREFAVNNLDWKIISIKYLYIFKRFLINDCENNCGKSNIGYR